MPRKPTGQILRKDGGDGEGAYAIRFRVNGQRHYQTLGTFAEGWTDEKARDELDRVMAQVRAGTWSPHETALRSVVANVIREASDDYLTDLDALAMRVLEIASEDAIRAELHGLLRNLITQAMALDRRHKIERSSDGELDLDVVVKPAGEAKRLRHCTIADVDTLGYEQEKRGKELLASAASWYSLSNEMRIHKAMTVGQLGANNALAALRRGKPYKVLRTDEMAHLAAA